MTFADLPPAGCLLLAPLSCGRLGFDTVTADDGGSTPDGMTSNIDGAQAVPAIASGTYVGDGADNRNVVVGFAPDAVLVKANLNESAIIRTASMASDSAKNMTQAVARG